MDNNSIIDPDIIKDIAKNTKKAEKELEIQEKAVKEWEQLEFNEIRPYNIKSLIFAREKYIYQFSEGLQDYPLILISNEPLITGNEVDLSIKPYMNFLDELSDDPDKLKVLYILNNITKLYEKNYITQLGIKDAKEFEDPVIKTIIRLKTFTEIIKTSIIFQKTEAVNIEFYKPEDYHDIKEVIDLGGFLGAKVDETLKQVFLMLSFDIDNRDSEELIRYAPHSLIFTGTKRGKTTLARHLGIQSEGTNTTPARLLGFSTSEEVAEGLLNSVKKPLFIDELEQLKENREIGNGFLTLMEQGIAEINKGKKSIKTRYGNAITFLSNRKIEEIEQEGKGLGFLELLEMINKNMEGLGSRLAVIVYNNNLEQMRPQVAISKKRLKRAEAVFFALRKLLSEKLKELLQSEKVRVWLELEYDEEFKREIENVIAHFKQQNINELASFWKSYLSSYRHFRGGALRLTFWQPAVIKTILNESYKEEAGSLEDYILERVTESYNFLKSIILDAINNLKQSDLWEQYGKLRYNELKAVIPELNTAEKILLYCIFSDSLETNNKTYTTNSERIKAIYEDIKEYLSGSYGTKFSEVKKRLKFENKRDVLRDLGLKVIKRETADTYSIIIEEPEKRKQVLEVLKEVLNLEFLDNIRRQEGDKNKDNKKTTTTTTTRIEKQSKETKETKETTHNNKEKTKHKQMDKVKQTNPIKQKPVSFVSPVSPVSNDQISHTRTATNKQKNNQETSVSYTPVTVEEVNLTGSENPEPKQKPKKKPRKSPFNSNLIDDILFILEQEPLTLESICDELQGKHNPIQVSHCVDYLLKVGDIMLIKDKKTGAYKYALKK